MELDVELEELELEEEEEEDDEEEEDEEEDEELLADEDEFKDDEAEEELVLAEDGGEGELDCICEPFPCWDVGSCLVFEEEEVTALLSLVFDMTHKGRLLLGCYKL